VLARSVRPSAHRPPQRADDRGGVSEQFAVTPRAAAVIRSGTASDEARYQAQSVRAAATLQSVRQDASPCVGQEPVPFEVEVTGLGDCVCDSTALARMLMWAVNVSWPVSCRALPVRPAELFDAGAVGDLVAAETAVFLRIVGPRKPISPILGTMAGSTSSARSHACWWWTTSDSRKSRASFLRSEQGPRRGRHVEGSGRCYRRASPSP